MLRVSVRERTSLQDNHDTSSIRRMVGKNFIGWRLALAAVCILPASASASLYNGTLISVSVTGTQYGVINVATVPGGRPGCHNAGLYLLGYAVDLNTNKGRALLAIADSAMRANAPVILTGTNGCVNVGNAQVETIETLIAKSVP